MPRSKPDEMRSGYTTGTCAAAAARAAVLTLLHGVAPHEVTIDLPIGRAATLRVQSWTVEDGFARCCVVKDAGDDPDVTHGAEICARAEWTAEDGIVAIEGGRGVGVVTRPGLGLEIGEAAINPVPRRMIAAAVRGALDSVKERRGVQVVVEVPDGENLAKRTLNARLGIVGGISILGTTGVVTPYSTSAYKACIAQAIDVARASGYDHLVLTTGGRSERFAQRFVELPEVCFVQMADFAGFALQQCARKGARKVTICAMIGKMSKLAAGHLQTHVSSSRVEPAFLERVAVACGADQSVAAALRAANTARHAGELAQSAGLDCIFDEVSRLACGTCRGHVAGALAIECILTDFDGNILGRAAVDG
ncbi:MAG: cobalt-precorrin-5B (C(1))-methyltransferase [Chloroflexota bacterium]|nr:MAG: cobalt-precorrin-5B (C(1))-methyltransferase [Chloroflexota bacterium]